MGDYFKPWRRKIGVLALVMACVLMAGWVRSHLMIDMIGIPKSIGKYYFCSAPEGLVWIAHDHGSDDRVKWTVLPVPLTNVSSYFDPMRTKQHWEFCGLYVGKSDGEGAPFYVIAAPYWSIVIPLTLLSVWMLLSKPRAKMKSVETEPTCT